MAIMKITIEDESGRVIAGAEALRYELSLGQQRFAEIEGAVEHVKQQLGRDVTRVLLTQAQVTFNEEKKTTPGINAMGQMRSPSTLSMAS